MTRQNPARTSTRVVQNRKNEASAPEWDAFYHSGKQPWSSSGLGTITKRYLKTVAQRSRVLEIGCGTGSDAKEFARLGFYYCGIDFSASAICQAKNNLRGSDVELLVADFFSWKPTEPYAVVYDKGVLHGLEGHRRRSSFANRVAWALNQGGIWISVAGSADNFDQQTPHGRLCLAHLAEAIEPYFEILQVNKGRYGIRNGGQDFDAWYGLFRRR